MFKGITTITSPNYDATQFNSYVLKQKKDKI